MRHKFIVPAFLFLFAQALCAGDLADTSDDIVAKATCILVFKTK